MKAITDLSNAILRDEASLAGQKVVVVPESEGAERGLLCRNLLQPKTVQ